MKLTYQNYTLDLIHEFSISKFSRKSTPCVLVKIDFEGFTGYGEASLPQYLKETQESVGEYLSNIDLRCLDNPSDISRIKSFLDSLPMTNFPAIAAVDLALHDLAGKLNNSPVFKMYNIDDKKLPYTSFTIGIDKPEMIKKKVTEAADYKILKIKLGTANDRQIIETVRSVTDKPIYADANGAWKGRSETLELIEWLAEKNVQLIEEPFAKGNIDDLLWLKKNSPLPLIADESIQSINDLDIITELYDGVNIKFMKCGGIYPALRMIEKARSNEMKILLGCMTETSCGISAACQLAPLSDWADLDGNLLISNDPFAASTAEDGRIKLSGKPGLGISLKDDSIFE